MIEALGPQLARLIPCLLWKAQKGPACARPTLHSTTEAAGDRKKEIRVTYSAVLLWLMYMPRSFIALTAVTLRT